MEDKEKAEVQVKAEQYEINFDINPSLFSRMSNKAKNWGVGSKVDRKGRPKKAIFYQKIYGKFKADFIKGHSQNIYLTFDEGYENGYSSKILDVLKEKQVPAVFFVTLNYVKKEPDLIQRMIDEGHVIGGHSVTHPIDGMPSLSLEMQLSEVRELHEYMECKFDYMMYLFRYPGGIFSRQSLSLVKATGYQSVFWSFAYRDWLTEEQPDAEEALRTATGRLHPGAIYLFHAVSATNNMILGVFIDRARACGYDFAYYGRE